MMEKIIISGGQKLKGEVKVSGAKNVAMKVILAGLLADRPILIKNVPFISSVVGTAEIVKDLGAAVSFGSNHTLHICGNNLKSYTVPLELGGLYRTATMVIGPLLARFGKAIVPNPGGCRIGMRSIERHIEGLKVLGATIEYKEGYFYAHAKRLQGAHYRFNNNTHTGTETLILAAVLAKGETVLENAAEEPEIDDLIRLLNLMGAQIDRVEKRKIVIKGVKKLNGAEYQIMPDRNEVVTFAIAALATGGDLIIEGTERENLKSFLVKLDEINAGWEPISSSKTRFYHKGELKATDVITLPHPGFMTDWQAPWVLLMTQAKGISTVHETIYENRFGYVTELKKMGAKIQFFNPHVANPKQFYNFNWKDKKKGNYQAVKIYGPTQFHNAVLEVSDLRAGATLLLGALKAEGESTIWGIEHIDRGYEEIENKFQQIGAKIKRVKEIL